MSLGSISLLLAIALPPTADQPDPVIWLCNSFPGSEMSEGRLVTPPLFVAVTKWTHVVCLIVVANIGGGDALDTNGVFDPCSDAMVQKLDGFTFGLAFSAKDSFFFNQTQLSPCDTRLRLQGSNAQLGVFRPKVDEISLLTIDGATFNPSASGGHAVAFAGRKYAARSMPTFVADSSHTITSLTLVLEFQKGTLQNLYWHKFGCDSCPVDSVCLDQQCAILSPKCKSQGGSEDCNLGIQVAFSGTDKNNAVLNSWYEVKNLRQYSLYGLYSNLRNSVAGKLMK